MTTLQRRSMARLALGAWHEKTVLMVHGRAMAQARPFGSLVGSRHVHEQTQSSSRPAVVAAAAAASRMSGLARLPGAPRISSRSATTSTSLPSLQNIEASWKSMSLEEREAIQNELEAVQKKDWTKLSLNEKKAAYYVAFGPHGPREPILPPGHYIKTAGGVAVALALSLGLFVLLRMGAHEKPRTMTREWQEAQNERAREQNINPISGISSEGYEGKGFVQSED